MFLHWSWFVVAVFEINSRNTRYSSLTWNVLEYLALFLIVMFHEFGHSLACRQVGGAANQIVLWPLGGVAYVDPPPAARRHTVEHRRRTAGECGGVAELCLESASWAARWDGSNLCPISMPCCDRCGSLIWPC